MADTEASIPTIITSPVPGISQELATLLIMAIKTRRKFLSKSSSSEDEERLQTLKENADDATTAFLVHLRKHVEAANSKEAEKNEKQHHNIIQNAATHCLDFLFTTLSDDKNSFHLRRAALLLSTDILERSSDARAFLNSGGILMNFVSVIQRVDCNNDDELSAMRGIFQQQAVELIARLSEKYGKLYQKFTVASRLMSEISVASFTRDDKQQRDNNMKTLRMERDVAIERGSKACDSLERMIKRADIYFKILVPRYGGFSDRIQESDSNENGADGEESKEVCKREKEDDDSIDWEEGDDGHKHVSGENSHTNLLSDVVDHHEAVNHTLSVMQRSSGLVHEGGLTIDLGSSVHNNSTNNNEQVRVKLKRLIDSLSSKQLHLNQWIHALSHTDGMEERTVEDTTNTGVGPVSLVLLSEEKRAMCRSLLKRMLKIKSEIELVFKAASAIQVRDDEQQMVINQNTSLNTAPPVAERKRAWLSSIVMPGKPSRKRAKCSKFKVIYRKK